MLQRPETAEDLNELLREKNIRALLFDLDGVVTQTARLHAIAWKKMFDEFLQNAIPNGTKRQAVFSIETDYPQYLDGISRSDGIQNFLRSRNINLPEGNPDDPFEKHTIWGLGNRKNAYYNQLLQEQGAEVYADTIAWVRQKRKQGFPTAIISASKNCRQVLKAARLDDLFDVRIDGLTALERNLKSKPEPDIFLEAAKQLNIAPIYCAVFEDARLGVKAGKAGNFGLVVGINRKTPAEAEALLNSGAHVVINQFPAAE